MMHFFRTLIRQSHGDLYPVHQETPKDRDMRQTIMHCSYGKKKKRNDVNSHVVSLSDMFFVQYGHVLPRHSTLTWKTHLRNLTATDAKRFGMRQMIEMAIVIDTDWCS